MMFLAVRQSFFSLRLNCTGTAPVRRRCQFDRVPQLQGYRFLVTGDQIVIVERGDRSIALVIDRA
jgi:hypothetical protein